MKKIRFIQPILAALVAGFLSTQSIQAAPTWNNAAGGNWSVGGNWSPSGIPGTTSAVIFGDIGAGSPNTDDIIGCTINSLTYSQVNGSQQTTIINPGQTLTINGSGAAGTALLYVGAANLTGLQVPAAITGAGGTLTMNGAGNLVVRQGGAAGGSQMATLDLSGLDTFNATIGRLLVAQTQNGDTTVNRMSGTLILAKTNNITLSGASPQVMVQDAQVNANGSVNSVLTFGQANIVNADTWRLGGQKGNALINFNSATTSSPLLKIRNADGSSPCTVIDFGYNSAVSTGNNTVCVGDFSLGSVDILANLVHIAQGPVGTSAGFCAGTLTLGAGTLNVGTLEIGYGNATGASGVTGGTNNVNNSGLFPAGALVQVSTMLRLARTNGGSATVTGVLNVNGGTVQANAIVSGGGVSAINLNSFSPSSTLIVTNTVGTLSFPVRTFSMSDATLKIPALNGGATMAVSNLTVGGSANTINISSIPPIGAYPATFTLINFLSGYTAGSGPLALGTLPPASPAYSGTLVTNNAGVIQLQLTAGPVVNLGMLWTGAADNNWDLTTYNWTFLGFPTNFFNGSSPLFDDSSAQTNVILAAALSPGSITVSNNLRQYNFTGSGNIAGAGSLTKKGSSALIIDNVGVDTIGTVVISSGTLQLGTGGVDGEISALNITNNGALMVNRSGSLTLSAAIAGTGTLTKTGNGTLILSGANSYSGATTVSGGTLQVNGASSGAGALATSAGTVLAGSGTVSGAVTVGGQMNPGPAGGGMGTFNANGGLTLNSGSTLNFDLSAANPASSDSINVVGNLNVNNNVIMVNFDGPSPNPQYTLFTYSGTLSGSFNATVVGTHFTATLDTSTPNVVYLNVSGSGSDLEWGSPVDTAWDSIATNWVNTSSGLPSVFYAGDTVLLDDSNGVTTSITLASGVTVTPATITDNATNNNFTISGAGHISGTTSIVKSGPSTLAINTANTFSGTVDVQAGTLQTGNGAALGTTANNTTIEDGATLDINGQNLGAEVITITGAGVNGNGALVNNGTGQAQSFRQLILAGDAIVGGTGLLGMNNQGGAASLSTGGNSFNLTKVGGNQFTLQNFASVDADLANIDIQQGIIEFSGLTSSMGDSTKTNIVEAGARVSFANSITWNKQFDLAGDGSSITVNNAAGSTTVLNGSVIFRGGVVFNVGGNSLTLPGDISGDGGLIKNGGSPLILTGSTLYTGDTTINGTSAIRLVAPADLSWSTNIVINSGAFLTVTGMVAATFPLSSDHTLGGHGVINGALTASAGSIVSPSYIPSSGAMAPVGLLTASNAITLSGTLVMELDPDNGTNDVLKSGLSTITYGGTLILTNLTASPLPNGGTYKLFSASSYLSSFTSIIPPTPGPGQTWDLSALGTTGTIKVASTAPLSFGSIAVVGTTIVISGSNGVASTPYYVLVSTNLALPLSSWNRIATNSFDETGHFSFTNSLVPPLPQRFYQIQLP